MLKIIHPVAGGVALLTIATFWLSTASSELSGSQSLVTSVKTAIPWGFLLLIPALAAAGGTGVFMAKGSRVGLVGTKDITQNNRYSSAGWAEAGSRGLMV